MWCPWRHPMDWLDRLRIVVCFLGRKKEVGFPPGETDGFLGFSMDFFWEFFGPPFPGAPFRSTSLGFDQRYHLVNIQKAMENAHSISSR